MLTPCPKCGHFRKVTEFVTRYDRPTRWCAVCRDVQRRKSARNYAQNRDTAKARATRYRRSSPQYKALKRQSNARYRTRKPEVGAAAVARRRADKLRATPRWANRAAMKEIYRLARLQARLTGIPHHVDHAVPLRHKKVCGLHCPANLVVVEGEYNARKGNKTWPDMP